MKKSTYSEESIEQLLQQMPKVKDKQDPDALFERLSSQLNEPIEIEKPKRKVKGWVFPTVASLAAALLIALIAPSLINEEMSFSDDATSNESADSASMSMSMDSASQESVEDSAELERHSSLGIQEDTTGDASKGDTSIMGIGIVFEEKSIKMVPENLRLITLAVPSPETQLVVPVSFLAPVVPDETVMDQLNLAKSQLNIEGLPSEYLENVEFSLDDSEKKTVQVHVNSGHSFGIGSTAETTFLSVIKETFKRMGYNQVKFFTDGKPGIELGNYGTLETLALSNDEHRGYFIYKESDNSPLFLVPNEVTQDADFQEILLSMKNSYDEYKLQASIPQNVTIESVSETEESVTITFSNDTNLFEVEEYVYMIDAILLAAGEYGFTNVTFKNTSVERLGPYDLTQPLLSAVAPNPLPYPVR